MNQTAQLPVPALQPVTQQQAQAWVTLAEKKNLLTFELQKRELGAQQILLRVQREDAAYEAIDVALAEYRKAYTEMVEGRKQFTAMIDSNIVQPLMSFEKRVDPKTNEAYGILTGRSLTLRKEEKEKADLANATNQEIASFKTHVENEFIRVVTVYRYDLAKMMHEAYSTWLREGAPLKDLPLQQLKQFLSEVQINPVNKFNARYLQVPQMHEIFAECRKPDYKEILDQAFADMEKLFANYESDLANAEAAIKHQQEQQALKEAEEKRKAEEEAAMTTLINNAEAVKIDEPKIKKTLQVVVVESEQWAKTVMAAFITNLPHLAKYFRVKSWSKLNVGQMANYLGQYATDSGEVFKGLQLQEVEK